MWEYTRKLHGILKKNAELHEVVVVCVKKASDVAVVYVLVVKREHGLALVGLDADTEVGGWRVACWLDDVVRVLMSGGFGDVHIDRADFNRQCPVLAHGGVVDVDAEVLSFLCTHGNSIRAPLASSVLQLFHRADQADVLADDLPAEVPERDVEPAGAFLDPVAAVP